MGDGIVALLVAFGFVAVVATVFVFALRGTARTEVTSSPCSYWRSPNATSSP
jgi:hypothetical protein